MPLTYLTELDLNSKIFHYLRTERSDENNDEIFTELEKQNIALIKTKLQDRYDVEALFNVTTPQRHYLIVKILLCLVIYDFIRRNAARKVPDDIVKDYEWAMKLLEAIKASKENPDGLPGAIDDDGEIIERIVWANTSNTDNYI